MRFLQAASVEVLCCIAAPAQPSHTDSHAPMIAVHASQGTGHRWPGTSCVHARQLPLLHHRHSSTRCVPLRVVKSRSPEIADRTKEYWDDEEDIEAAVERLGINKVQQGQESSPLHSKVNKMYLTKTFADGFLGPLELRLIEGKTLKYLCV